MQSFIQRIRANFKDSQMALLVIAFFFALAILAFSTPVMASPSARPAAANTATSTPTNTPTSTPTPTNTPIATPISMIQGAGYIQAVRCGAYGITPVATGDCFQGQDGGGLSLYSAEGGQVVHVNGETGQINASSIVLTTPIAVSNPGSAPNCQKVNVAAGSATLVPGTYPTAVSMGVGTLNGTYSNDNAGGVNVVAGSGVVTVNVYQRMLTGTVTPQAATTTVAVAVCTQ